jgi:hypothetical protein
MAIIQKGSHVLRAKIDMSSTNMLMRDPLMYRVLHHHHHRTANDWKIYQCMIMLMAKAIIRANFACSIVRICDTMSYMIGFRPNL